MPVGSKTTMAHPFPRLQTDGFWHRVTKPGYDPDKDYNVTSISKLNEIYAGASGAAGGEIILPCLLFSNFDFMSDYYQQNYKKYHDKTFPVDPTSFLTPFAEKLKPGATILDIGCGSGRDLLWFKNRGFKVIGFERSHGLASLAMENVGCQVIEGDFETYDFSRLSVDAIMLVGALVHLPHIKVPEVLNSITEALKGNGKILLTLKKGTGRSSDPHGRVFNLWQDDALRKLFNRFELVAIDFFQQSSEIGTDEVWLGYVLEKAG
jgi:SAM-dependent methyltransferase